jgi:hypothetical protein
MSFFSSLDPTRVFRSPTRALNDAPGGQKEKIVGRVAADVFSGGLAEAGFKQSDAINLQKARDKAKADYDAANAAYNLAHGTVTPTIAQPALTPVDTSTSNAPVDTSTSNAVEIQPAPKSNVVPIAGGLILAILLLKGFL